MSKLKTLSWNDRFAVLDHFKPSDAEACSAFNVTQDELKTAREMRTAGAFTATPGIDVDSYASLFSTSDASTKAPRRTTSTSTTKTPSDGTKPATATKKVKEPQKRGRKGDNIAKAFGAIPSTPTAVDAFAAAHGVSVAVLRQSKRFDKSGSAGAVHVKKDKDSKTLMIWREVKPAE